MATGIDIGGTQPNFTLQDPLNAASSNAQLGFSSTNPIFSPIPNVYIPNSYGPMSINLRVTKLKMDNKLEGVIGQSPKTRHFYPRSFGYGNLTVTGRAKSQVNWQDLAKFIRAHQEQIVVTDDLNMMELTVNNEGLNLQGFIPRFTLSKRGVFDPAPEYTFEFVISYYQYRSLEDSSSSEILRDWHPIGKDILPLAPKSDT